LVILMLNDVLQEHIQMPNYKDLNLYIISWSFVGCRLSEN